MTTSLQMGPKKFALLIGVDTQMEHTTRRFDARGAPLSFNPLHGCNEDIAQMRAYLTGTMKVPETNITQLLSPESSSGTVPFFENAFNWFYAAIKDVGFFTTERRAGSYKEATYRNIVDSFHNITETARPGDHVYIHYSGHGALATTIFPELKGENATDECLVPCDVFGGGNFIRDLEMALMLHKMAQKGLAVTIVLDCCFSGGLTRQPGAHATRRVSQKYRSAGLGDFPATREEILVTFRPAEIRDGNILQFDNAERPNPLSLKPHGYTLLAACRENQVANEHVDRNGLSVGLLTHSLLESLRKDSKEDMSADMLFRKVRARVCSKHDDQVPLITGDKSKFFFSSLDVPTTMTITVQEVNIMPEMTTVILDAGTIHGVCKGAEYSIFANTCLDFESTNALLAHAVVTNVYLYTSQASIVEGHDATGLDYGCQAVLTGLPLNKKFSVGFMQHNTLAFKKFTSALRASQDNHYKLLKLNDGPLKDSSVLISEDKERGVYEILESTGRTMPILNALLIPISIHEQDAESKVLRRIMHIAQYRIVQTLKSHSQLNRGFAMEVCNSEGPVAMNMIGESIGDIRSDDGSSSSGASSRSDRSYSDSSSVSSSGICEADDCSQSGLIQVDDLNIQVMEGTRLFLRIKNSTAYDLYVALFDLSPEFGIQKIWPDDEDSSFIRSGGEALIEQGLTMFLEESLRPIGGDVAIVDTLKAFATRRPAALPFGLNSIQRGAARNGSEDLQYILDQLETRDRGVLMDGGRPLEWHTSELRIQTLPLV